MDASVRDGCCGGTIAEGRVDDTELVDRIFYRFLFCDDVCLLGRVHMPVWPMLMLFAAYGIQIAKTNARVRKWWPMVLVLEVVACLAWNWFKLKGRGMI